jgi:hypothetical protein
VIVRALAEVVKMGFRALVTALSPKPGLCHFRTYFYALNIYVGFYAVEDFYASGLGRWRVWT